MNARPSPDRLATAERLVLDESAIERARSHLSDGAVTPSAGPWLGQIASLLNDSLATELVCVMRYRRHHFTAKGLSSPAIAAEFLVHANEELAHAEYDESAEIKAMVRANLVAERVAIETYRQMITLIADKDPTTRRLLESILAAEEEHAEDMLDLLEK